MADSPYDPRRELIVDLDDAGSGADAVTDTGDAAEPEAPPLSWAEQEVLTALKRLARAQSNLQALESTAAPARRTFDPDDAQRLETLATDLAQARAKASGRFAKAAARQRLEELEMAERLLLDRLGVASYEEYRAIVDAPAPVVEAADPEVVAFARQELAAATEAWLAVQALEVPDVEPDPELDDAATPPAAEHPPAHHPTPGVA